MIIHKFPFTALSVKAMSDGDLNDVYYDVVKPGGNIEC
jgi:hypothetical protein